MATNFPTGDGRRYGAVRKRSQVSIQLQTCGLNETLKPVSLWMLRPPEENLRESAKKSKSRDRRARRDFPPRCFCFL